MLLLVMVAKIGFGQGKKPLTFSRLSLTFRNLSATARDSQ